MSQEKVSLATLNGGAAVERFNDELTRVLENILDPNTNAKSARTVTLKVTVRPNEDRNFGAVDISTSSHMAPPKPVGTTIFFGKTINGEILSSENNQRQLTLEVNAKDEKENKVVAMGGTAQ